MKTAFVPLEQTGLFSKLVTDYISNSGKIIDFYGQKPTVQGFATAIDQRLFEDSFRKELVTILKEQYRNLQPDQTTLNNLDALKKSKTFTVTTGHQLNIFTGPLYFIYKIVTTINLALRLKQEFPDNHFVPVYWMASEDHDFDEINHTFVSGEKVVWHSDQKGAVGRFSTKGLEELSGKLPGQANIFRQAYQNSTTLSEAVRRYVNDLFKETGLVVIDADDHRFKRKFVEIMKDDLLHHTAYELVIKQSENLKSKNYRAQLSPREINLFYLKDQLRERLVQKDVHFNVNGTSITFTKDELLQELESHPERFSPNVILRPVYQETILPNLAYIGGPSEIAYWMQLKSVFEKYKVDYPILIPRNFVLYIPSFLLKKIRKLGLEWHEIFEETNNLLKHYVKKQVNGSYQLGDQKEQLSRAYDDILIIAGQVDVTLESHIRAEQKRVINSIKVIENKILKAEKRKHQTEANMIRSVREKLFPKGQPQERIDNILGIYESNFIGELLEKLDPLDFRYHVLFSGSDD